eukprot:COSAG01_NODE_3997_length_5448_cov_1.814919_8_plen_70_part_00
MPFVGWPGNKNGLLLPSTTTDQELVHLRNSLPDEVAVQRIDERACSGTAFVARLPVLCLLCATCPLRGE